jgi:hypothetical protein
VKSGMDYILPHSKRHDFYLFVKKFKIFTKTSPESVWLSQSEIKKIKSWERGERISCIKN